MDVHFLHTGEPVLVIEDGEGEPGGYAVGPNGSQVWQQNADYRPAKVVRLGTVEEVEQGQISGPDYADTSTAQREQAIADGTHPARMDAQYVHEAANEPAVRTAVGSGGSPVVGTPEAQPAEGEQTALTDTERDELNRLREQAANRQDPARLTDPAALDTTAT